MKTLLVERRPKETRLAVMEDKTLLEMHIERDKDDTLTGNIFLGRVQTVLSGMQAAFLDIGLEKNAFLYASDFTPAEADVPSGRKKTDISQLVKVGQEIPVQIIKLPGGTKAPRVSGSISLPGRMCVLMPNTSYIGVSKRIENEEARKRLRENAKKYLPAGMGLIIRTAAEFAGEDELEKDITALIAEWNSISTRAKYVKAPVLLYKDHDLVFRCVRDMLTDDVSELITEDESAYRSAVEAARLFAPAFEKRIRLVKSEVPLFTLHGVKKQLDCALSKKVWLKSGGYLVFDRTEALTVIDVITGKFTGKNDLSDTVLKTNLEAAKEVAHQIRLRDIGGIIIIVFIYMEQTAHKEQLVKTLREAFRTDKTHTNVVGLTSLGLVEMTRKRKKEPIETLLKAPCPLCGGEGHITSPDAVAFDIFGALERQFSKEPGKAFIVRCAPRVFDSVMKISPPLSGRAYALPDEKIPGHEFEFAAADESSLPPKSHRISGDTDYDVKR